MLLRLARTEDGAPEIFRSIPGDGAFAGRTRTFVRLSGCNLHCRWCDTAYTWNWQGSPFVHQNPAKYDPAHEMIALPVAEAAQRIAALPCEGLVITGGEPLLQGEALAALIDTVKANDASRRIEIETNGSIAPAAALAARVDHFAVSPKLAHSGNPAELALKRAALSAFAALESAAFKFVAQSEADLDAVAALAAAHAIPASRIYIMAEGVEPAALSARNAALIGPILARGYNFTDRLHIHLFGQRRG
ncbi:MAG: 7-carboxy-7-deazaguanine synthase QueE, partial [Hyphomonadaceae bacterium]|nr:7-carboxy-7-deazaguanine synthase QueE [Hyphomonadaceae bacterium]